VPNFLRVQKTDIHTLMAEMSLEGVKEYLRTHQLINGPHISQILGNWDKYEETVASSRITA